MPTAQYNKGFRDAVRLMQEAYNIGGIDSRGDLGSALTKAKRTPKRKLSPWNKFVKANSKKPRFIYKSGSNKGKLNLKKMGVAFRKTPAGKRKK